jgi:hypothetical protein
MRGTRKIITSLVLTKAESALVLPPALFCPKVAQIAPSVTVVRRKRDEWQRAMANDPSYQNKERKYGLREPEYR